MSDVLRRMKESDDKINDNMVIAPQVGNSALIQNYADDTKKYPLFEDPLFEECKRRLEEVKKCNHIVAHGYEDSYDGFIYSKKVFIEKDILGKDVYNNNLEDWIVYFKKRRDKVLDPNDEKGSHYHESLISSIRDMKNVYELMKDEIDLFKYCPECGYKIDWSKYEKELL